VNAVREKAQAFGRRAEERWNQLSAAFTQFAEGNPARAALTSLGAGIVLGLLLGHLFRRD
jgi:hypothetical protein